MKVGRGCDFTPFQPSRHGVGLFDGERASVQENKVRRGAGNEDSGDAEDGRDWAESGFKKRTLRRPREENRRSDASTWRGANDSLNCRSLRHGPEAYEVRSTDTCWLARPAADIGQDEGMAHAATDDDRTTASLRLVPTFSPVGCRVLKSRKHLPHNDGSA